MLGRTGEAVGRGVGDAVITNVFDEFLHHQWMVTTSQRTARFAEMALAGEEQTQFAVADAVIVLIDTEVDEVEKNQPVDSSELECTKARDKLQLGIGGDKLLESLPHVIDGGGIINQVVEDAVHRLEELKHIEPLDFGQLGNLVIFQGLEHISGDADSIPVLHIAVAEQAASHQRVKVLSVAQHPHIAHIEMTSQVAIIDAVRTAIQADGKQHSLDRSHTKS